MKSDQGTLVIRVGPQGTQLFSDPKILELVKEDDPILHSPTNPVDISDSIDNNNLSQSMLQMCKQLKGFGLSANQVGVKKSIFVLEVPPEMQGKVDSVYLNPKIVEVSDNTDTREEGCLSFPYLFVKIKRPSIVKIEWTDLKGQRKVGSFVGLTARVIQHEIDHLNGLTILDRLATSFEKRWVLEKRAKRQKEAKKNKK